MLSDDVSFWSFVGGSAFRREQNAILNSILAIIYGNKNSLSPTDERMKTLVQFRKVLISHACRCSCFGSRVCHPGCYDKEDGDPGQGKSS